MIQTEIRKAAFWTLVLALLACPGSVFAQGGGGDDDPDDTGNLGGVEINADGLFQSKAQYDRSGNLDRQRLSAARDVLNSDVQKQSKLRKVSLNRLEAEYRKLKQAGKPIPPEMTFVAGITRLTHVFFYPETNDIVIAGPAEGFFRSSTDRIVGMKSGQPVLQLDDLVVALRSFGPDGERARSISCSIDPTQQGLANLRQAVAKAQQQINANRGFAGISEAEIAKYFQDSMGFHQVTVKGVSPKTRFAQVLVDADYHMKLIGIGLEQPPVRITSFVEQAAPGSGKNSLQRWYFRPNYDYVRISQDENAMHLDGGGVELVGEDEMVNRDGQRRGTGRASRASRAFTNSFTKMYDALSRQMPVYAELRNVIDMSIASAFIQEMDFYGEAGWKMEFFGDEKSFPIEKYNAPTTVLPAINAVWKSGQLMTPIGGGVNIQPRVALNSDNMKTDESGSVAELRDSINVAEIESGQWWWD